jgi:arabinogalactan oligomer / maltooligosaccharide transport system substrate-binding protein
VRGRYRVAALLATMALVAACGGGGGPETSGSEAVTAAPDGSETAAAPDEAAPDEGGSEALTRAEGDLVIWGDENRVAALEPFAEQFGEENGVTVALQEVAVDELADQFQRAGPAGEGPDIAVVPHDAIGRLVDGGTISPVDIPNADDFEEVAIDAFTFQGQTYGLPYATENVALVRNTDLVPEAPATWEDLERTALELQESGDVELGLALQADPADPFHNYPLYSSFGARVFGVDEEGTYQADQVEIDSDAGLAAADAFAGWVESGLINPSTTYDVMIETFGAGDAAFAITGPWAVTNTDPPGFAEQDGLNFEVTPIPPTEGGDTHPFVGVQGFVVSSFSENALLAQTFATDFMATEEAQLALFEAGGRPPALTSALEQVADDPIIAGFADAAADGHPTPAIPEMGSAWTPWTDAYELIYDGQDPRQAFTNAAEQIRNLIEA